MHFRNVVAAVVAAFPAVAIGAKWTNSVANTPDTAYLWSAPENWQDGAVGGEGDSITNAPSVKIYVRKDTSSAPARISSSNNKVFLLGGLTVRQTSTVDANIVGGINIYGDIAYDVGSRASLSYVSGNANYCGRVSHNGGGEASASQLRPAVRDSTSIDMRMPPEQRARMILMNSTISGSGTAR